MSSTYKHITIHTDGGCQGNPGVGAWAATLVCDGQTKEISGGVPATTNNRMELQGAIEALSSLKTSCVVDFYTDSNYVKNGVTTWVHGWKVNGWKTKAKQPVKNEDLWRALDEQARRHKVTWHWLKGHAGHVGNERCDLLANEAMAKVRLDFTPAQLKEALAAFVASTQAAPVSFETPVVVPPTASKVVSSAHPQMVMDELF